jgi:SagB-type dehydrogenase family enzyme
VIALVAAAGTMFTAAAPGTLEVGRTGGTPDGSTPDGGTPDGGRTGGTAARLELDPELVIVLAALDDGPVGVGDVPDGGWATVIRLARAGLLQIGIVHEGRLVLRASLTAATACYRTRVLSGPAGSTPRSTAAETVRLSRFAIVRRHGDGLVLDAPVAGARITVDDPRVLSVVGELAGARTLDELVASVPDCPAELVRDVVAVLAGVGAAGPADADGRLAEDRHPVLRQRELADVLLHTASRGGLGDQPIGGTYPFLGVVPPAPAVAPVPAGPSVALPRPDMAALRAADPPLAAVMEDRSSVRAFGQRPVTVAQLGEFLWRTARVRSVRPPTEAMPYELSDRPAPSGGGAHDLEIYLSVLRCDGLAPGVWHYEAQAHALTAVSTDRRAVVRMLAEAHRATGGGSAPQVLLTLATRFDRVAWKYRGIAYALTLKNVGVLCATMQLAATAMGLGGCPLGTGNAAVFAEVTGRDVAAESSVGEFLLGSLPTHRTGPPTSRTGQ